MLNSSRTVAVSANPKLQLIQRLIRECFTYVNHSVFAVTDVSWNDGIWCPRTFDGFACWRETPPGTTVAQPCPEFVVGFDAQRLAYKTCTENGSWLQHPETNKPWTNYTTCVDVEDLSFRSVVNSIYVWGYSISVAALLLSLVIFIYFRSLHCTRIRIHMHLFTSFALNNVLWIVWYRAVVTRVYVVQQNEEWCQILHIVTNYFMVTSYIWMFCEGLHLHIALVVILLLLCSAYTRINVSIKKTVTYEVFVKDEVAMRWFIALGWGLSLLIVGAYAGVRYHTPGATERCWMDQSDTFWIIIVPVVVSLFSSFVFLINVVRVLLTKLYHVAPSQHAAIAAKKATRAALILIPLFGLHFVLIPLRPPPDSSGERAYQIVSALITSLQGLCVAILFCFTNHEVTVATRARLARMLTPPETFPITGLTGGESIVNTRDNVV